MNSDRVKEAIIGILAIIGGLTVVNIIVYFFPTLLTVIFYGLLGAITGHVVIKYKKNKENK
ncbi:hypothetical protein BCPG3_124 [Bacillus phage BCPG3]|uniref:Uncharacterized protein n=3 Tax=Wphvirus TaxID=1922327 RepID=W5QUV3_9CAUD|nr:hypothetical protein BPS13_0136 [Bacillus phage BPS13]YP_009003021.1 hypothetical protein BPS10C_135 [Bacillus phage BPS10C]YP_009282174.1 hypothetical protein SALINJAH_220 [Bacillus phage SalinJah]QQO38868.1 hypothetical protein BCPG1_137 [Bacillus phage BCPG1]QSJ04441.1 hypothetical protein BCPG3_124 [Bacillus phage BCPG3]QSJ04650.1 hypothetical protein BCP18_118 [Bacillus phage BCP18]AEZ50315.1 hypothetical protein BPS13_0136 [Bacillus phage BPS13]AGI12132.1 hypothetical protein BPS10C